MHTIIPGSQYRDFKIPIIAIDASFSKIDLWEVEESYLLSTQDLKKAFDGSPLEGEKYIERSIQIATEMFYVFSAL
jgi:hypothetical protein